MSDTKRPAESSFIVPVPARAPKNQKRQETAAVLDSCRDTKKAATGAECGGPDGSSSASVDVCDSVGLKPGDRIEVKWDLHVPAAATESSASTSPTSPDASASAPSSSTPTKDVTVTVTRWWGATLLHPDGRTHVLTDDGGTFGSSPTTPQKPADVAVVPIRVLDYDPCAEFGFPERSLEEVVFLSDHNLLNLSSGTRAHYRREGSKWEPSDAEQIGDDGLAGVDVQTPVAGSANAEDETSGTAAASAQASVDDPTAVTVSGEEGIRTVLDSVLMKALGSMTAQMGKLDAAQQRVVASKIAAAKEKLVSKMTALGGNSDGIHTFTPGQIKKCMEEVGQELEPGS